MTQEELNYIKDSFSQIIDDIAGNPEWYEAARAIASELGSLERELEKKVVELPSNLDEAAELYSKENNTEWEEPAESVLYGAPRMITVNDKAEIKDAFKAGAKWMAEQVIGREGVNDN